MKMSRHMGEGVLASVTKGHIGEGGLKYAKKLSPIICII
jgi:hypothetical protein